MTPGYSSGPRVPTGSRPFGSVPLRRSSGHPDRGSSSARRYRRGGSNRSSAEGSAIRTRWATPPLCWSTP